MALVMQRNFKLSKVLPTWFLNPWNFGIIFYHWLITKAFLKSTCQITANPTVTGQNDGREVIKSLILSVIRLN